jgi:hypothetical protein
VGELALLFAVMRRDRATNAPVYQQPRLLTAASIPTYSPVSLTLAVEGLRRQMYH